jgi:hypothetical protein
VGHGVACVLASCSSRLKSRGFGDKRPESAYIACDGQASGTSEYTIKILDLRINVYSEACFTQRKERT